MSRGRAVVLMFVAVVLFSTSGVLVKLSTLDAISLTAGRSIVAGLVFWAWLRRPHFTWSLPQISGAFAFIGATVFFVAATQATTAANAVLLQFTAPVYVAVIGIWFLGERASRIDWLTIALSGLGMALFFSGSLTTQGFMGNVYAILSGVSLAWLVLSLRKQKDGSSLETVLLGSIIAGVAGLPFLLRASPTPLDVGIVVFLGIFQLGIPMIIYTVALRRLSAIEAILIQTLEPILNPIWVFLVVGEQPGGRALLGGLLVLVSVTARGILAATQRRRRVSAPSPAAD